MPSSRRDELVECAMRLFAREGFHATGIDRILQEAGVAKMTLYKHFKSKDELILAALRRRDETFRNWFVKAVESRATGPADRLLAIFDVLAEWCEGADFCGCMFINAAAEYAGGGQTIHAAAAEHKRLILAYVRELCLAAGCGEADALAEQICLLMDGAVVSAHVTGRTEAGSLARRAAQTLLDANLSMKQAG